MNPLGKLRDAIFTPLGLVTSAAVAFGVYYLLTNHGAHLAQALPYALLGACLFMHLFMHRGGHGDHSPQRPEDQTGRNDLRRPY